MMGLARNISGQPSSMAVNSLAAIGGNDHTLIDVTPNRLPAQHKAAIIVRLLVGQGVSPGVNRLPSHHQTRLAHVISKLGSVDRATLAEVVRDFSDQIDNFALSFPDGLTETLELLEPHLAPGALDTLRTSAERADGNDPWTRVSKQSVERLRPLMDSESAEVCAVLLSKIAVGKAAALLVDISEDRAQILAHTVALTETITPELVERIGVYVAKILDDIPPTAFQSPAAERVGAILNSTPQAAREKVLDGLSTRNSVFAREVRKSIFSFNHIPMRVEPVDVAIIVRKVDAKTMITAMAAGLATTPLSVEFLLENMSKRLAEQMRDEAEGLGLPKTEEGEAAMADVVRVIRDLEAAGEFTLLPPPEQ